MIFIELTNRMADHFADTIRKIGIELEHDRLLSGAVTEDSIQTDAVFYEFKCLSEANVHNMSMLPS